jgi:hypothetical protein
MTARVRYSAPAYGNSHDTPSLDLFQQILDDSRSSSRFGWFSTVLDPLRYDLYRLGPRAVHAGPLRKLSSEIDPGGIIACPMRPPVLHRSREQMPLRLHQIAGLKPIVQPCRLPPRGRPSLAAAAAASAGVSAPTTTPSGRTARSWWSDWRGANQAQRRYWSLLQPHVEQGSISYLSCA